MNTSHTFYLVLARAVVNAADCMNYDVALAMWRNATAYGPQDIPEAVKEVDVKFYFAECFKNDEEHGEEGHDSFCEGLQILEKWIAANNG